MDWAGWLLGAAGAYLLGAVPFGVLIGRIHGVDIREHGSRNIGATNVGRVLGRRWGILCFLLDAAKGAVPVAITGWIGGTLGRSAAEIGAGALGWWLLVAAAALAGHMASPFIGFKGGKGVATGFGALVAFWPLLGIPALAAFAIWIVMVLAVRMVSAASIVAALSLPVSAAVACGLTRDSAPVIAAAAVLSLLVVLRHRANIGRILRGVEPRIGGARRREDSSLQAPTGSPTAAGEGADGGRFGHNGGDVRA